MGGGRADAGSLAEPAVAPVLAYVEREPPPPLRRFVRRIWDLESPAGAPPPPPDRVLPDGCVEVVLHYHDAFRRVDSVAGEVTQHRHALVGQIRTALALRPLGRVGVLGIRFEPAGAGALFRVPMHEATARSFALEDVLGRFAAQLADAVHGAVGAAARIAGAERVLMAAAAAAPARRGIAEEAAAAIVLVAGSGTIGDVCADLGVSGRRLERRFRDAVGISPKALARIVRFQAVLRAFGETPRAPLVAIAAGCGYADQSHFTREFAELSGEPPARWLAAEHPLAATFVD